MKDGLDLGSVQIHNSPDVRHWPITATLTKLEFRSSGVHVEHTKNHGAGAWPNFRPPTWQGDLQYTLWIFLNIGGTWHGSGCIQFWQDCDQNGGPPEEFAKNWYYAADRWAPMTGHQPAPGELVGFMVSAGDARNRGTESVQERSQVAVMPFPSSGATYTPPADREPPEPPQPPPTPPDGPDGPLSEKLAQLLELYNELVHRTEDLQRQVDEVKVTHAMPAAWRGQVKVPFIGGVSFVADSTMTLEQLAEYKAGK